MTNFDPNKPEVLIPLAVTQEELNLMMSAWHACTLTGGGSRNHVAIQEIHRRHQKMPYVLAALQMADSQHEVQDWQRGLAVFEFLTMFVEGAISQEVVDKIVGSLPVEIRLKDSESR